jgi:hypothetical protein
LGISIFIHAVRLVLNNLNDAWRISAVLYFGPAIVSLLFTGSFVMGPPSAGNLVLTLLLALASVLAILWLAVAWHRFVLLDESPTGPLPEFHGDRMLKYFGYGVRIGVISVVVATVVGIVLGLLVAVTGGSPEVASLVAMITMFVVLVINYRLSAILPGAALGRPMTLKAAWEATAGATGDIVVLAIVSALAIAVIDMPGILLVSTGWSAVIADVWYLGTGWLKVMVAVSISTTLYGHFIEKRPLPT